MNSSCDLRPGRPAAFHASCSVMAASISASSTLLGGCAVPQGLQRVVLVHRDDYGGFPAEVNDVMTVML